MDADPFDENSETFVQGDSETQLALIKLMRDYKSLKTKLASCPNDSVEYRCLSQLYIVYKYMLNTMYGEGITIPPEED